jgi:thymidylate synthase
MHQRSADVFLGLPFNIASYALLVNILCTIVTNRGFPMTPGGLEITLGDVHLYEDHVSAAVQQLIRPPFELPSLKMNSSATQVEDLTFEDFQLEGYTCYPVIRAPMIA